MKDNTSGERAQAETIRFSTVQLDGLYYELVALKSVKFRLGWSIDLSYAFKDFALKLSRYGINCPYLRK